MSQSGSAGATSELYYRHALPVRLMHWINVLCLAVLFMSGLNIFNAHPALNWGKSSYTGVPPFLEIGARMAGDRIIGVTRIAGREFETTGVLGAFRTDAGETEPRAFPSWLTVPGTQWLAMARRWHFFFAWLLVVNGLAYVAYSLFSRHLGRDLAPTRQDWRGIGQSIVDHLRFKHPVGEAAKRYNVLQKLAYLAVIFFLLPLLILMGLAMSPWLNGVVPGWIDIVGGRQSARTLHFIAAWLLVAFVLVHVFEVVVSGLWNHLRSMITGRYRITMEAGHGQQR
ncbi:MAG: cytochrome b/b6 domain-containing protein [Betaproteobacteria bacterium]|nr:cytochrome b/b6 domain-containing protein [Betaproteobacteria bacterium]